MWQLWILAVCTLKTQLSKHESCSRHAICSARRRSGRGFSGPRGVQSRQAKTRAIALRGMGSLTIVDGGWWTVDGGWRTVDGGNGEHGMVDGSQSQDQDSLNAVGPWVLGALGGCESPELSASSAQRQLQWTGLGQAGSGSVMALTGAGWLARAQRWSPCARSGSPSAPHLPACPPVLCSVSA
jgi:hypothetical protein